MSRAIRPGAAALLVAALLAPAARSGAVDADGRAMLLRAQKVVAAYHAGAPRSGARLRVVYFVPADVDPLPAHAERLDRVMADVDAFYRSGLGRLGVESGGLPLEREGGKVALHLVRGKRPASDYHYSSGDEAKAEVRDAMKGTFDLDREHVLILYALCRKGPDGRYLFDAPYYGVGDQRSGLCHAADCELLDPVLLRDTGRKIVYTEHYYPRVEETVARFNTKYLGGTAHELGHGLGLPHDDGSPPERRFGVSLMGVGNLSYRSDIWGTEPTAYLSRATALRLVAHPLITGSDRGRWDDPGGRFDNLRSSSVAGTARIEATLAGAIPPYAAIAHVWPTREETDHRARTYPALVGEGGAFALDLEGLAPDTYHLRLAGLHANGAATTLGLTLTIGPARGPDEAAEDDPAVRRAEEAVRSRSSEARALVGEPAIAAAPTPGAKRLLGLLRSILDPPPPADLASTPGDRASLPDAVWSEARVGWGEVARNSFWSDERSRVGLFLRLGGHVHGKGLYAHSPSLYAFPLDGKWKTFRGTVGLRDGAGAEGSAVFIVLGDGRELRRSRALRVGQREDLVADVAGVRRLELRTEGAEGHNRNSWAIWVEPEVSR